MAKKPRMGSDPFQKKDPLGWIGGTPPDEIAKGHGEQGPLSNPQRPGKVGNPSKHQLPCSPSTPGNPIALANPQRGSTTSKGLRPGWTRATFIVREDTLQKLKAVAYWDRKELKRVVEEAFHSFLLGKNLAPVPRDGEPER
jgi:hypothetical protein